MKLKNYKQTAASIVQEAAARCETALMHISVSTLTRPDGREQKAFCFKDVRAAAENEPVKFFL